MCALGYQPPSKKPPFFAKPSPSSICKLSKPPLFRQFSPYIFVFREPPPTPPSSPPKIGLFSEPPQYNFSSLNLPHDLNLTKFLAKISHFNFLVMTEKNNFVDKFFLSLNISAHYVSIGAFPDIITHKHLICYSVCQL